MDSCLFLCLLIYSSFLGQSVSELPVNLFPVSQGWNSEVPNVPDPNNQRKDRRFEAALKRKLRPQTSADVLAFSFYFIAIV
jgi:hypothetical protein